MEEKSFSEKMEEFVETFKLYIVQNISEIVEATVLQPLERMRYRMIVTSIALFLCGIAFVALALALSFLYFSFFSYINLSGYREFLWGLSFFAVFATFMLAGYMLLRRMRNGAEGNK